MRLLLLRGAEPLLRKFIFPEFNRKIGYFRASKLVLNLAGLPIGDQKAATLMRVFLKYQITGFYHN